MFERCKHTWVEVKRVYIPPDTGIIEGRGFSAHWWNKIIYGYTVIELKCDNCGDIITKEFIGDLR